MKTLVTGIDIIVLVLIVVFLAADWQFYQQTKVADISEPVRRHILGSIISRSSWLAVLGVLLTLESLAICFA